MKYVLCFLVACGTPTKVQDHNSSRSNKSASIIAPPDPVLPMSAASAVEPSCVEVQITAGDDDPDGRANGDPVHGVDVKLGCANGGLERVATTDDDGVATFCDLEFTKRGAFVLTAEAEGSTLAVSEPVLVVRTPRFLEWTKEPAAVHAGVPVRSADGSCPQLRVLSGKLRKNGAYAKGDPIHGVDVKLGAVIGGAVIASATTDSNGDATFCGIVETKTGAVSYEPWTQDDLDDGAIANPLYQPTENDHDNPLFEGREARTTPVIVGPYSTVVQFVRQPPVSVRLGMAMTPGTCPAVGVYAANGFHAGTLDEKPGAALPGVEVSLTLRTGGGIVSAAVSSLTGPDGTVEVCTLPFGQADAAFVLQASAAGARPVTSAPILFATK